MLLWAAADCLTPGSRGRIEQAEAVAVSAASIWEIEIKRAAGKLSAPADVGERALEQGFDSLPISFEHAHAAGSLPPLHNDPFDRMLVAQAQLGGFTLATADGALDAYGVPLLRVERS